MLSDEARQALLIEIHKSIDTVAQQAASTVGKDGSTPDLAYPPGAQLSEPELDALRMVNVTPSTRSALQKVIADACSAAFFRMFSVMDGVGDPDTWSGRHWPGISLAPKPEHDEPMLHDDFFESYWLYRKP